MNSSLQLRALDEEFKRGYHRLSLEDLMMTPIQRVTRYPMLLTHYQKYVQNEEVTDALKVTNALASRVNSVKETQEKRSILFDIFQKVRDCPVL
jgi:hypothetical protein